MSQLWRRDDGYEVSDDPARLDRKVVFNYLAGDAYWIDSVTPGLVDRMIAGTLCFGVYDPAGRQVGFARVLSDRVTRAWLSDVFILAPERGRGLGVWLIDCILKHPELQGLRRWILSTLDAHGLYRKFGFQGLDEPERMMELKPPPA
jgi:GNAT superfamily N-acetyltransferase